MSLGSSAMADALIPCRFQNTEKDEVRALMIERVIIEYECLVQDLDSSGDIRKALGDLSHIVHNKIPRKLRDKLYQEGYIDKIIIDQDGQTEQLAKNLALFSDGLKTWLTKKMGGELDSYA